MLPSCGVAIFFPRKSDGALIGESAFTTRAAPALAAPEIIRAEGVCGARRQEFEAHRQPVRVLGCDEWRQSRRDEDDAEEAKPREKKPVTQEAAKRDDEKVPAAPRRLHGRLGGRPALRLVAKLRRDHTGLADRGARSRCPQRGSRSPGGR